MKIHGQIFHFSILKSFTAEYFVRFSLLLFSLPAFAQLNENFDDGDLSSNPAWLGMTSDFSVESGQLRLTANSSGNSYIATPSSAFGNTEWRFDVVLGFNPSSSNYARIYLVSDVTDLSGPLNGYYVQIGGSSDEVSLYRQTGSTRTKVIDGSDGRTNLEHVVINVRVTRTTSGEWSLSSVIGGEDPVTEGSALDPGPMTAAFIGVSFTYTATRADRFWFDNFEIRLANDASGPSIVQASATDARTLVVTFSERIDATSGALTANYEIDNSTHPVIAALQADEMTVSLRFASDFPTGKPLTLRVVNVTDTDGNTMLPAEISFVYVPDSNPSFKSVIVSELLADPSPRVRLPEAEYVELYNRSAVAFNLRNWQISDGSSSGKINDDVILHPGDFVIITAANSAELFSSYGRVVPVTTFPSLNNGGDFVIVRDASGQTVDSIRFDDSWHRDTEKREGGWALELIDTENVCDAAGNWTSSDDDAGGTPGWPNSVDADNPDVSPPQLLYAFSLHPDTVTLVFSESLSRDLPASGTFEFSPALEVARLVTSPGLQQLNLVLASPFPPDESVMLKLPSLSDCAGNLLSGESTYRVIRPQTADSLDVVISEILFNPRPGGVDFLEIHNTSTKHIDLLNWSIGGYEDGSVRNAQRINRHIFLAPDGYLAFSSDPSVTLADFPKAPSSTNFTSALPAFNDDSGGAALITPEGLVADRVLYDEEMHSVFLKSKEGVSLERLSGLLPGTDRSNWRSASGTADYGTPGYRNSNTLPETTTSGGLTVAPEVFAPLSMTHPFTIIRYDLGSAGFVGSVKIYDQQARLVRTLADNELLGIDGYFQWEGERDNGAKAPVGAYIVAFEAFNGDGQRLTYRHRVAVAGEF